MENPLADGYFIQKCKERKEKEFSNLIITQTDLVLIQLHSRKTLKNKKKLDIAVKEIREFADMLETLKF